MALPDDGGSPWLMLGVGVAAFLTGVWQYIAGRKSPVDAPTSRGHSELDVRSLGLALGDLTGNAALKEAIEDLTKAIEKDPSGPLVQVAEAMAAIAEIMQRQDRRSEVEAMLATQKVQREVELNKLLETLTNDIRRLIDRRPWLRPSDR